jgi:molybdenum cofactor guanylyltransferase
MTNEAIALIVNAGGESRRMGQSKALLTVPPDATPLIVHIVRRLAHRVSGPILIVSNDNLVAAAIAQVRVEDSRELRVLGDQWPQGGALGGVATGLAACEGWAMVVACDMPFVDAAIFSHLLTVARAQPQLAAVIPVMGGQSQPFHGLWHRRSLPALEAQLLAGRLAVQAALHSLHVAWVDEDALGVDAGTLAFTNVNTPEEWVAALTILQNEKGR